MTGAYVHGYDAAELERLQDQAATLEMLLHGDTAYPDGSLVLEAGCGVGAQSLTLARRSPGARFESIDLSAASVEAARRRVMAEGVRNVVFRQADLFDAPFAEASFDHVFVCFVLEHLARPADALRALVRLLKPGGTMTLIEGDHGSTFFHPDCADARAAIACQVALQRRAGGDAMIGRRVRPLMVEAGLVEVSASPRLVYVDGDRPALAEGFVRNTFTAMIAGVRAAAIEGGLADDRTFDAGLRGLLRAAEPDGVFSYCFFKGVGVRPA